MKALSTLLTLAALIGALATLPAHAAEPATAASLAGHPATVATFESCKDAVHCTFLRGTTRISVVLANVDAPKLEGGCTKEILAARRARDELVVLLRSAAVIELEIGGAPDAAGAFMANVLADGADVGHVLAKRGLTGSKASWMRKSWC